MIKALSPNEILDHRITVFPPEMIKAVNNLLMKEFNGSSATILSKDIVAEFMKLTNGEYAQSEIFKNKWLDFETIFQKSGWKVDYDGPGYNESYAAKFNFTPKK